MTAIHLNHSGYYPRGGRGGSGADGAGHFKLESAAGDYQLYAWTELDGEACKER